MTRLPDTRQILDTAQSREEGIIRFSASLPHLNPLNRCLSNAFVYPAIPSHVSEYFRQVVHTRKRVGMLAAQHCLHQRTFLSFLSFLAPTVSASLLSTAISLTALKRRLNASPEAKWTLGPSPRWPHFPVRTPPMR